MNQRAVRIADQFGQPWLVMPGDPAWPFVARLWHRGVREIVLPRHTVRTGELAAVTVPANLSEYDITRPAVATLFRRAIRLRDCVSYLRGERGEGLPSGSTGVSAASRTDSKAAVGAV